MSMTIELSPEQEARVQEAAAREGLPPIEWAARKLLSGLPEASSERPANEDPTLALFARWAAEDATDDPDEIRRRNEQWELFKRNMNETRALSGRPPAFP